MATGSRHYGAATASILTLCVGWCVAQDAPSSPFADGNCRAASRFGPIEPMTVSFVPETPRLFPFFLGQRGNSMDYIDRAGGKVTHEGFWMAAADFSEGLATVEKGQLYGYVDEFGKVVIPLRFADAGRFSEGLARVGRKDEHGTVRFGYIGHSGRVLIPRQFDVALEFTEGVACVKLRGLYGFIDKAGAFVIKAQFQFAGAFSDSRAPVGSCDKCGYIDHRGKLVVETRFLGCSVFDHGVASVQTSPGNWAVIDSAGEVLAASRERPGAPAEGLIGLERDGKWGFVDVSGHFAIPPRFDKVGTFSEGLAAAWVNGKAGYVDKTGVFVIPPRFADGALPFSEGLALVHEKDDQSSTWGYIDRTGQFAIPPKFNSESKPFHGGLARVMQDQEMETEGGYIDKRGHFVWRQE